MVIDIIANDCGGDIPCQQRGADVQVVF